MKPDTLADSIAVGEPRNGRMALRDVRESKGKFISVTDGEMFEAIKLLASSTGIFGELAGVASIAGIRKEVEAGVINKDERIVALITGSGLKDIDSVSKFLGKGEVLEADVEEICEWIERG